MRNAVTSVAMIRGGQPRKRSLESDVTRKRSCVVWKGAIGKVLMATRWSPTLPQARFCRPAGWVTAPLSLTTPHSTNQPQLLDAESVSSFLSGFLDTQIFEYLNSFNSAFLLRSPQQCSRQLNQEVGAVKLYPFVFQVKDEPV